MKEVSRSFAEVGRARGDGVVPEAGAGVCWKLGAGADRLWGTKCRVSYLSSMSSRFDAVEGGLEDWRGRGELSSQREVSQALVEPSNVIMYSC